MSWKPLCTVYLPNTPGLFSYNQACSWWMCVCVSVWVLMVQVSTFLLLLITNYPLISLLLSPTWKCVRLIFDFLLWIRNRTLSTTMACKCVYMCACIVIIPPMGGMVLILVFTFNISDASFDKGHFFYYLCTVTLGFTKSLTCQSCKKKKKHTLASPAYYCGPLTAYYSLSL